MSHFKKLSALLSVLIMTLKLLSAQNTSLIELSPKGNGSELVEKLEQVFGENFLKSYPTTPKRGGDSSEEFSTVEEEYLEGDTAEEKATKYPIIIPGDDAVVEGGEVIQEGEEEDTTDVYISGEDEGGRTRGRISTSAHFKRTCGDKKENCDKSQRDGGRPLFLSFSRNPHYCRCDRDVCSLYGDCCWTIAVTLLYRNPWKCSRVQHDNTWALMITKCSEEYKSLPNSDHTLIKSCEDPLSLPLSHTYTHLHDIPAVANLTKKLLYRNIYCARCNGLNYRDLHHLRLLLRCSQQFNTTKERETFISRAKYQRGKRIWTNEDLSAACGIFAPELDQRLIEFTAPGLRYCRKNAIDKCPKDFAMKNPTIAGLCNSYTQYVESRPGFLFKNPHCAQCYGLDPKWDLRCLKDGGRSTTFDTKITPSQAGASLDSMGLSLLFDFDLNSEGNYVGYESTCPGDSIWDFLRQKCTTTMCSKDHELDDSDGTCKPIVVGDDNASGQNETESKNSTDVVNSGEEENNSSLPSCYILIVHDSEYTRLPNDSIIVNVNHSHPLIFHPEEYQVWNETSISICARDLSSSFRQRFSPILNYLSLGALGLSVFFSFLHILLFLILPKMRNLPGKNLFCLTLSLFISQLLFLSFITSKVKILCVGASILMHYFFLASFYWMNVMSFDIWRTFSSQFVMRRHSSSSFGGVFLKYSMWGWFSPLVVLVISVSIDFFFDDYPALRKIRPLYGHNNTCWIGQGLGLFIFFALPAVILIILNIFLFTFTAKAILEQSKDVDKVFRGGGDKKNKDSPPGHDQCSRKTSSSSSEAEVQRMKLYMKLGVIMGVTWILGFLSGISEWEWLWYFFVLVNGLQGTFIFFGFDFKPKVWNMLKERLSQGGRDRMGQDRGRRGRRTEETNTTSTATWRRDTTTSSGSGSAGGVGIETVVGNVKKKSREESISHRIPT